MARVLVVDDDPALLRALRVGLGASGHEVITAANGEQGLAETARSSPEVVILDLGLPDMDGLTVCRRIRAWNEVPIIVLSAHGSEARKVAALDGGANDYVTKPFGMAELEARIRTALRYRRGPDPGPSGTIEAGRLVMDREHQQARVADVPIELTAKEFEVLAYLAANIGKVCTHQMLLTAAWGAGYAREAQYLHAYVHRLRHKLGEESGVVIKTAPGIGYRLTLTDEPDGGLP